MAETGENAPDFTLPGSGGTTVTLSSLRPGRVVVYFYPKDDTPGCTIEASDFSTLSERFAAAGVTILGISRDSVAMHDNFVAKHGLGITLLSDADGAVCEAFGVWVEKKNYGRSYMGISRSTFLIGPDGRVEEAWHNVRAKDHAQKVLDRVLSR